MYIRNYVPFIRKILYWVVMLIVSLSALGGVNLKTAHAQQNTDDAQPAATITLSVDKNSFGAAEDVILHVTITNPGSQTIKALRWLTPIAGVEEPLFVITRGGEPINYLGVFAKRADPTGQDYVSLTAGESVTSDVNLGSYYDLAVSGNYTINYSAGSDFLYLSGTGGFITGSLSSNTLNLSIEGRPAISPAPELSALTVIGDSAFNSCTALRQADLISARTAASAYMADAATYFGAGQQGDRYTTWFGVYASGRYNTVSGHFSVLRTAIDNANPMIFDCTCSGVSDPAHTFAYVNPDNHYTIHLCGAFWSAAMTGTDSKAGTLIHETSHFTVVANTDDVVYGQSGAKSLAINNPANAIRNADSHEYFAENTPASSELTYSGPMNIISGNAGAGNVTLTYIGETAGSSMADVDGLYSFSVPSGWDGTVTPTKTGYTFSPVSKPYTNVTIDQTAQNYTATSTNGDIYEYDDSSAWAKLISSGAPQTRSILPAADVDWVKFQLTGSSAITLETSGATNADTQMLLYDSGLNQLAFDDDGGAGYYSKINRQCGVNALSAGTYYARVQDYGNNSQISSYGLSFIAAPCIPVAFNKISPADLAINQSLSVILSWEPSADADSYEYCIDTTDDNACALWLSPDTATTKSLSGLSLGTTYYWQVRAINGVGTMYANGSEAAFRQFTTGIVPAVFNKFGPVNSAIDQSLSPVLKWASSNGVTPAASYEYCYDTTNDNACSNWIDNGAHTNVSLSNLFPLTTYYWHVRAKNEFGITNSYNNEWWMFTTKSTSLYTSYSASANDGWMLESSETSNVASTKSNVGTLRVGDDALNRQVRSLLYFDTASLPDKAVITKVILQIKKAGVIGTPTYSDLVADMKKGFLGLSPLELTDFNAAAEQINNAGKFILTTDPSWYRLTLSTVNFKYINLFGATQFRIRFTKDDNNDKKADYISFYAGDAANADQPQLVIEYWLP